jgi:hypothetical protein
LNVAATTTSASLYTFTKSDEIFTEAKTVSCVYKRLLYFYYTVLSFLRSDLSVRFAPNQEQNINTRTSPIYLRVAHFLLNIFPFNVVLFSLFFIAPFYKHTFTLIKKSHMYQSQYLANARGGIITC